MKYIQLKVENLLEKRWKIGLANKDYFTNDE